MGVVWYQRLWAILLFVGNMANANLLKSFLGRAASSTVGKVPPRVTICIGNEAADADSIISALCLAYLRQSTSTAIPARSFIPLVSAPRSELALRRETELLLQSAHLELSDLVCLEEVNLANLRAQGRLDAILLVDHNSLSSKVADLLVATAGPAGEGASAADVGSLVEEIFDHHQDARLYPHVTERRHIAYDAATKKATAGSTCTLIYEEFLRQEPEGLGLLDAPLATLLLGVICLDTSNGDAAVGKAEPRDVAAMAALQFTPGVPDRDALYARLRNAKMDPAFWRSLSTEQCLLLDYKQQALPTGLADYSAPASGCCNVGISSVLQPLAEFAARPGVHLACRQYMDACSLDVLVVMTFVLRAGAGAEAGVPNRELLLVARSPGRLMQAHGFLSAEATLALEPLDLPDDTGGTEQAGLAVKGYAQGNIKASRKQVLPILENFYQSLCK